MNRSERQLYIDAATQGGEPEQTDYEKRAASIVRQAERIDPGAVIWGAERRGPEWVLITPNGPLTLNQIERDARARA